MEKKPKITDAQMILLRETLTKQNPALLPLLDKFGKELLTEKERNDM